MENPAVNINPWKGLNFYKEGEIIYGRNSEIESLSQYILNNTQTVLYGKSGIGKSSILNAGVFPIARQHGLIPVGIRLDHSKSVSYIRQIENAIVSSGVDVHEIQPAISENSETLWEYLHRNIFFDKDGNRSQLLLVLDQFEEIFTLQKDEKKKLAFFDELADLINDVTPLYIVNANKSQLSAKDGKAKEVEGSLDDFEIDLDIEEVATEPSTKYLQKVDYHVVFTLREDFLSFLERYTKFIPVMKSNRYALLPLNEEQAAEIIMKPRKGLVEQDVAKLIIQKVTGGTDFSLGDEPEIDVDAAILSLYLSRIYVKKKESDAIITAELVNQFSDDIIKDFYEESVADIPIAEIEKIEDQLLTYDGRRNNVSRNDLVSEGISESVIDTLVDDRKLLRQFSYQNDIRVEFMHDILCPVVDARINQREETKRKEEERQRQEEEKQRILLEEKTKREKIEREAEEERNRLKEEAKRTRKRNRRRMYGVGAFVLVLLLGIAGYIWKYEWEHESYFAQFERVNGWPVGVGKELSPEEMKKLPLYYKLSHNGYKAYDTDVEVCSSNGCLPLSPRIFCLEVCETDSDSKAKEYLHLLSQIKSIHFEAGEGDRLAKEVIKGENDSVLYYVNYFYLETEGQVWAQFVSSQGQAMPVRGNGLDRIKLSWYVSDDKDDWRNGRVTSMIYYDAQGVHQDGANGIYGYQIDYSDNCQSTTLYSLDQFGLPFDAPHNAVTTTIGENNIETKFEHATRVPDSTRTPVKGPNGFWREVKEKNKISYYTQGQDKPSARCLITTDAHGNTKLLKMEGNFPNSHPTVIKYTYDERTGYCTSEEKRSADNRPFYSNDSVFMKKWEYDENGQMILEEHYVTEDRIVYAHHITKKGNVLREELRDEKNKEYPYIVRVDSVIDKISSSSYYGENNTLINYKSGNEKVPYHRVVVELSNNQRTTKYFRYDDVTGKEQPQVVTKEDNISVVSFFCKKEELDKDGNVVSSQIFDKDGNIIKSMLYYYQNGQNIGRAVKGIEGTPVRCDKWEEEGYMYYKFYYNKDFDDMYSGLRAVDEWGHRSSTWDGYDYLYLDWFHFKDKYVAVFKTPNDLQSNSNRLGGTKMFKKYDQITFRPDPELTDFEIPYIHILSSDSKLYNNKKGLRDGDRIIELGKWKLGQSIILLKQEWLRLLGKGEVVHIEVLRPIIDSNKYVKKTFDFACFDREESFIEYHVLKATRTEKKFAEKWID